MSSEEAVGRSRFHLSLLFMIPLIVVLLAIGPLWIAIAILSKSVLPTLRSGFAVPPSILQDVIRSIAIDFWISSVLALVAGLVMAYALVRPISQFRRAFQEIMSGRSPRHIKLETSGEFARLSREFNQMVSTLEHQEKIRQTERLAGLGALAAGVAHEIRNPLGSIRGLAQLLSNGDPLEAREKYAREIITQVDRLNRTLGTLLELSRPSNRTLTLENINKLLHQGVELLRYEGTEKEIQIEERYDPALPDMAIDHEAMLQAVLNILLNAIQAIPKGGRIVLQTSRMQSGWLVIIVSNSPSNLSEPDLKRIFDPYYTTKTDGTGIGLAITHQVVTAHGGRIEAQVKDGQTIFNIELPISQKVGSEG